MKTKPDLGIKDPYELNEAQYKAALDLLRNQRKLVGKYWHDAFVQIDDFTNEGVVASSSWQFQANILKSKNRPIATVVPAEGATGWADTTMMHSEAKNPNCAYLWLEHSLNTKLQGDLAAWFGSVPVVLDACKGNKLLGDGGCERQGLGSFEKIAFWKTPTAKCATPEGPVRAVPQVGQRLHRGAGRQINGSIDVLVGRGAVMTAAVSLEALCCIFGAPPRQVRAVDGVDLSIAAGEFFTLLGPSGSGKTTCLRMIGGFTLPSAGRILIGGEDMSTASAVRAAGEHRVPGLCAVPAHEHPRQRRLLADGARHAAPRAGETRRGAALAGAAAGRRRPPAGRALRRPAPARGAGARADQRAAGAAARRAARRARPQAARADAERAQGAAAQARHHVPVHHARPARGACR